MKSTIANKLASLNYRQVASFVRLQKSQHKYIVSKNLSGLKTFQNIDKWGWGGGVGLE